MSGKRCKAQLVFWLVLVLFFFWSSGISENSTFCEACEASILTVTLQPGKLADLYKSLCAMEQEHTAKNPENKSPYKLIFEQTKLACIAFQNEANSVKVHLPKAAAKSRGKKAPKVEPEDD